MTPNQLHEAIISAAKNASTEELKAALRERPLNTLSVIDGVAMSPVTYLAFAGDEKATDFLLRHGGNIQEAVKGYAYAGNTQKVDELLKKCNDVTMAIFGYALHGYGIKQIKKLLPTYDVIDYQDIIHHAHAIKGKKMRPKSLRKQDVSLNAVLEGYALGGHVGKVDNWLAKKIKDVDINAALKGYAQSRNVKEVNELLAQGADIDKAVHGYAYSGHVKEVNDLLARGADINAAIYSYARGGHEQHVNLLIRRSENINYALLAYEHSVNLKAIKRLLTSCSFNARELLQVKELLEPEIFEEDEASDEETGKEIEDMTELHQTIELRENKINYAQNLLNKIDALHKQVIFFRRRAGVHPESVTKYNDAIQAAKSLIGPLRIFVFEYVMDDEARASDLNEQIQDFLLSRENNVSSNLRTLGTHRDHASALLDKLLTKFLYVLSFGQVNRHHLFATRSEKIVESIKAEAKTKLLPDVPTP